MYKRQGLKPILKDIDFTIPAGSTFAILGGTGSGKSTLMHLLNRLYDLPSECGKITIDGTDIAHMKREWVRKNIGMVLQEPFLYSRTIQENIAITRPDAGMDQIRYAAQIAVSYTHLDVYKRQASHFKISPVTALISNSYSTPSFHSSPS